MTTKPLLARLPAPPRKIAVLRASRLGDFLCAAPALRALRAAVPQAEITMITLPLLRDLTARSPFIDRFVAFPGYPGIAQQFFTAHHALEFFQRMQNERFDLAIQLQGSGVYANPFTSNTAGFIRAEDDPTGLDAALVWPDHGHEIRRLLALMQFIGVEPRGEELAFPLLDDDRRIATELLAGLPRPLIGIHAGSHDPLRRWPLDRFASVARTTLRRYGGTMVLLGGLHDSDTALELAAAIGPGAYNLTGRTSLGVLGAVIADFAALITNDSGPAHVGFALRTPTVTIYRCGGTERYGPLRTGPFAAIEPPTEAHDGQAAIVAIPQVLAGIDRLMSSSTYEATELPACPPESELVRYAR
jgi:ADP-heptose:LPS heptosyltransferase